ncbi:MAG: DUF4159 domain-containing protein [Rhodospirillales bacterium]|nr:DUF4159 domain-containing protein [Rhodospirillales bacterium]
MSGLGFLAPGLLWGLLALPVLWWLLRVVPPPPKRQSFPPLLLLADLVAKTPTSQRTPWWLLLLRLAVAALLILGLAHPVLNPPDEEGGEGPLVLAIDDGWAAARSWEAVKSQADRMIKGAQRRERAVLLVTTAPGEDGNPPVARRLSAQAAAAALAALVPKPWPSDRRAAARALGEAKIERPSAILWLGDGIEDGGAAELAQALSGLGKTVARLPDPPARARLLKVAPGPGGDLAAELRRAQGGFAETVPVRAQDGQGRVLGRAEIRIEADKMRAEIRLDLPMESLNRIQSVAIEDEVGAGATALLDEGGRRRPVGLAVANRAQALQPLTGDLYYVERALAPYAEVRSGEAQALLERPLTLMILGDTQPLAENAQGAVERWIAEGGVLVRFAGSALAEKTGEPPLVPVRLRGGGRNFGGALSWTEPARLAPFAPESPFAGLPIPEDVRINTQVLAEPGPDLARQSWARLTDGTPLVTARRIGKGWLILVHVSANTGWSNLPISGLFVEMLRRLTQLGTGIAESQPPALAPQAVLDGFGRLVPPGTAALPLKAVEVAALPPGPKHPPGYYGPPENRRARNLAPLLGSPKPIETLPDALIRQPLAEQSQAAEIDLKPALLAAAFLVLLADLLIVLRLRGLVILVGLFGVAPAEAADEEAFARLAGLEPRLAYILTGDANKDTTSRLGLEGLTRMLARRTTVELAAPQGLWPESDPFHFFPLIYWPAGTAMATPSQAVRVKVGRYLAQGGLILFDSADATALTDNDGAARLGALARALDLPSLKPVPGDHVLGRSYYLLQSFPGRHAGGPLWIEAGERSGTDGVTTIVAGRNDWAAAWAQDAGGRPLFATEPGGEMQREMAFRFGINLVMMALTGNYKSDQVHLPIILERLRR